MFDIGKLVRVVENRMNRISIENEKCCKSRSVLSKCTLCEDICPNSSVSVNKKNISLNNNIPSKAIKVSCLGGLSLAFLLSINSSDFPVHIIYNQDLCKSCSVINGLKVYLERIERIRKFKIN